MRAAGRGRHLAAAAGVVALATVTPNAAVHAAPNPGQPVENDYGQTDAEVAAEVAAAVNADPAVVAARSRAASARTLATSRTVVEAKAKKAYKKALKSHKKKAITRTKRAYRLAHARAVSARAADATARAAAAAAVARATTNVRWLHYRPVDGIWQGARSTYYIPDDKSFHPIEVRITVSGGHVTSVSVPVYETSGETGRINEAAIPVLIEAAMAAQDTAEVSNVSGASLTSYAFRNSLSSALLRAGYHA